MSKRHRGDDGDAPARDDVFEDDEKDEGYGSRDQVAGRTCEGNEDVVALVVLEVTGCDGGRLGPAEEHTAVVEADEREDDGAERVQMLDGVERDAAEHLGRWITKAPGGPGVGALMHAEGEDENDDLEDYKNDFLIHDSSLTDIRIRTVQDPSGA